MNTVWFIFRVLGKRMGEMFPDAGPREGESREDYLKRLKNEISTKDYINQALEELATGLTKGVEKGFIKRNAPSSKKPSV